MSEVYKPETITELLSKAEKVLVDAHNSGYIIGVNQGVEVERERIIRLLEDERFAKAFGRSKDFNAKRANLIALIKGKNK